MRKKAYVLSKRQGLRLNEYKMRDFQISTSSQGYVVFLTLDGGEHRPKSEMQHATMLIKHVSDALSAVIRLQDSTLTRDD